MLLGAQRRAAHELAVHAEQRTAHQHVAEHGGEDEEGAEAGVHVGEGGVRRHVGGPVNEAPGVRVLQPRAAQAHVGQRAEEHVGRIDRDEREAGQPLVHVVAVEVGVVDGQVALDTHGTDDAEAGQAEEEQDEGAVLAERFASGPLALHVRGDGHRTHQQRAQQVGDGQPAYQRIEGRLLLLLARLAQHHDRHQVAHHPEDEHHRRDGHRAVRTVGGRGGGRIDPRRGHDVGRRYAALEFEAGSGDGRRDKGAVSRNYPLPGVRRRPKKHRADETGRTTGPCTVDCSHLPTSATEISRLRTRPARSTTPLPLIFVG